MTKDTILESPNPLQIRRLISASPERVFRAWTDARELIKWWGPTGVSCVSAEVDLRVGGQYRIANELPNGKILWISGQFELIEHPKLLKYSWIVETTDPGVEQVTVQFERHELGTEIIITHEQVPTATLRDEHQRGWAACMDGLNDHLCQPVI